MLASVEALVDSLVDAAYLSRDVELLTEAIATAKTSLQEVMS